MVGASYLCVVLAQKKGGPMNKHPDPFMIDDENPEWTDDMLARAKRGRDMPAPEFFTTIKDMGPSDTHNTLEGLILPPDLAQEIKSTGPGYGTRVEAALRAALAEGKI
jgi:uncharacterized protein (DUF4415 family)